MLILLFSTSSVAAMTSQEIAPTQSKSYRERIGTMCSWLAKPFTACCKKRQLQAEEQEPCNPPVVQSKQHKQAPHNKRTPRISKKVVVITVGIILLLALPHAGAMFNNLQDFLTPTICVAGEAFKRCCTIVDNAHVSCCVTDNILGIEVCKDYLVTMPETASIPFRDLSRIKDQCSVDLTLESQLIRQEFDGIMQGIERGNNTNVIIPEGVATAPQHFLKKLQESLVSIGIPQEAPLTIVFMSSGNNTIFLDAASYKNPEQYYERFIRSIHDDGLGTIHLRSNLFKYLSVNEIFATLHHELGHLLAMIRKMAKSQLEIPVPHDPKTFDFRKHNEEIFADLTSALTSAKGADQMSFLRQHVALQGTGHLDEQPDTNNCFVTYWFGHPPSICRIAYLDSIQNQLDY